MWNDLMNESGQKANIIVRSHVHYFSSIAHSNNRIVFTTPALQGYTNFGAKECEGNVDFGFIKIDIGATGTIEDFKMYKANLSTNVQPIYKV
jgi:hypothetical protein